jgi:hypothetical protein
MAWHGNEDNQRQQNAVRCNGERMIGTVAMACIQHSTFKIQHSTYDNSMTSGKHYTV